MPSLPPGSVRIPVRAASASYPVDIRAGATENLAAALDAVSVPRRRFIVSSPTVWRFHGERLRGATAEDPVLVADGERAKNLATVGRIYDSLIKAQADRGCAIVAVGGGVIGDMAGFAAATFLRGIPVVQVPTTLLAQVDAAIGGKTGVNHPLGKNLIGSFHQPVAVIVDPQLLTTLPRREFRAGLYETIKYGVIASRTLFDTIGAQLPAIFARDAATLVPIIAESCRIKAEIVSSDERESGLRRILNLGHTAGHALEAVTKYRRFRHGEAVAYGMMVAAELASARGVMPAPDRQALTELLVKLGPLPPIGDLDAAHVVEAVSHDKKVVDGTLHYILPTSIGTTIVATDVGSTELRDALIRVGLRA